MKDMKIMKDSQRSFFMRFFFMVPCSSSYFTTFSL
jgi:hypothetical protein